MVLGGQGEGEAQVGLGVERHHRDVVVDEAVDVAGAQGADHVAEDVGCAEERDELDVEDRVGTGEVGSGAALVGDCLSAPDGVDAAVCERGVEVAPGEEAPGDLEAQACGDEGGRGRLVADPLSSSVGAGEERPRVEVGATERQPARSEKRRGRCGSSRVGVRSPAGGARLVGFCL